MDSYHGNGRELEYSENVGHEDEPFWEQSLAIIIQEIAENKAFREVTERPIARDRNTQERHRQHGIANA